MQLKSRSELQVELPQFLEQIKSFEIDMVGLKYFTDEDFNALNIPSDLHRKLSLATGCYRLPVGDCIKINTDRAAKGNPGPAGVGSTFRDSSGRFLLVYNRNIDNTTNYIAACSAILESTKEPVTRSWHSLWVETDSVAAGTAFNTGKVPCVAYVNKVETTTGMISGHKITKDLEEVNFSALLQPM
ncbi:hypothetical protein IFM89_031052 [Coptis chinensis]|uniref:RNase H type-1 domain-containing protein n=1 Tax=Coptis chinensis TaxID=261450 RepID=A0A835H8S3_9MAGN|nr:hypothetical protein IFM89_031052 [Coptis chinensis]